MSAADWLERNLAAAGQPVTLSEGQRRCATVLGAVTAPSGLYNLPTPCGVVDAIGLWTDGMDVLLFDQLATYDRPELTRLVVAAHEHCVRVAISPWRFHTDERRARLVHEWAWCEAGEEVPEFDPEVPPPVSALVLSLTARVPGAESWHDRHPSASDLIALVSDRAVQS